MNHSETVLAAVAAVLLCGRLGVAAERPHYAPPPSIFFLTITHSDSFTPYLGSECRPAHRGVWSPMPFVIAPTALDLANDVDCAALAIVYTAAFDFKTAKEKAIGQINLLYDCQQHPKKCSYFTKLFVGQRAPKRPHKDPKEGDGLVEANVTPWRDARYFVQESTLRTVELLGDRALAARLKRAVALTDSAATCRPGVAAADAPCAAALAWRLAMAQAELDDVNGEAEAALRGRRQALRLLEPWLRSQTPGQAELAPSERLFFEKAALIALVGIGDVMLQLGRPDQAHIAYADAAVRGAALFPPPEQEAFDPTSAAFVAEMAARRGDVALAQRDHWTAEQFFRRGLRAQSAFEPTDSTAERAPLDPFGAARRLRLEQGMAVAVARRGAALDGMARLRAAIAARATETDASALDPRAQRDLGAAWGVLATLERAHGTIDAAREGAIHAVSFLTLAALAYPHDVPLRRDLERLKADLANLMPER